MKRSLTAQTPLGTFTRNTMTIKRIGADMNTGEHYIITDGDRDVTVWVTRLGTASNLSCTCGARRADGPCAHVKRLTEPAPPAIASTPDRLRAAVLQAPASGPVADKLRGVWTPDGYFVCAPCVGRLIARGCSHMLRGAEHVWTDRAEPYGDCCIGH